MTNVKIWFLKSRSNSLESWVQKNETWENDLRKIDK